MQNKNEQTHSDSLILGPGAMPLVPLVESLITKAASSGIRPGLERIERLLSLLGSPHASYPAVHVVGTNGKGSTCAFLASVLQAAGYKTALYTSPHLESPEERLTIDGRPLEPERWLDCARKAVGAIASDALLSGDPPSYFEIVTAVAFLLAAEEKADAAVVEAGLGGRLDATNLLPDVACTAIASISMDHMEYLGDTLEAIAGEKFAVIRPGVPACYLGDNESLIPLFERFCRERQGARGQEKAFVTLRDAELWNVSASLDGCEFDFSAGDFVLKGLRTRLTGRYQVSNAALALSVLRALRERFSRLTDEAIRAGILNARWPGRFEIISGADGSRPVIVLDGGHNPDGVARLVESASELWRAPDKEGAKIAVVYAAMKDKDYPACLEILSKLGAAFFASTVPGMERALTAEAAASAAKKLRWRGEVKSFENPLEAIAEASKDNDVVLVCGSLYFIGWVRQRRQAFAPREAAGSASIGPVVATGPIGAVEAVEAIEESGGQRWLRLNVSGFDVRFFLRGPMLDMGGGKGPRSRAALSPILGEPGLLITPKQVHGVRVLDTSAENAARVTNPASAGSNPDIEADGILFGALEAAELGAEASLRFADCAPVVVAPSREWVELSGTPWVLMLHSGYKGTVLNIARTGVNKARERYGDAALAGAWAWVGPCVGASSYPRDRDEWTLRGLESFRGGNARSCGEKVFFDIAGELRFQLAEAGIAEKRIFLSGIDTCLRTDLCYSYRGGDKESRMVLWARSLT